MRQKIADLLWWLIGWLAYLHDELTDLDAEPQIEAEMHHVHDIDDMW